MLLWTILVAIVIYLLFDALTKGPLFREFFRRWSPFLFYHPRVGKALGIKYFKSNEWSTNRNETKMSLSGGAVVKMLLGLNFMIGNRDDINHLKARQRRFTRPVDLSPYVRQMVGKKMSLEALLNHLIPVWVEELTDVYGIVLPVEKERYAELVTISRTLLQRRREIIRLVPFLFRHASELWQLRKVLTQLDVSEALIMLVPFLTTVDSSILNFATNPDPIHEFHELFQNTPVLFIPVETGRDLAIVEIIPNKANHPGNTVFGPTGVICPGNTVTSMLMKSVADLKRQFRVEVEGKIEYKQGSPIKEIANAKDVYVVFHERDPSELAAQEDAAASADVMRDDQR